MTQSMFRDDIPLTHLTTLRSSAVILQRDYEGMFGAETIERFLITSYDDIASRMTNDTFLAMFAERFARERLTALARVEGKSDDLICVKDSGQSLGLIPSCSQAAAAALR